VVQLVADFVRSELPKDEPGGFGFGTPEVAFHVDQHRRAAVADALQFLQRVRAGQVAVLHRQDHSIIRPVGVHIRDQVDAVFVANLVGVRMRIEGFRLQAIRGQLAVNVDHAGVADVGHVFLERPAEQQDVGMLHGTIRGNEFLDRLLGDALAHAIVDAAAGKDDLRMITEALSLEREIIRVDADAVTADEAGTERQEIPLRASRLEDRNRVEAHAIEDERELVHQRDVQVALGVLDDLRGLGRGNGFRDEDARGDHGAVDVANERGGFRRVAGDDLADLVDGVLLVAGVDALGRIAGKEVLLPDEATGPRDEWEAVFLGATRINRRLIDDGRAGLDMAADHLRGLHERREIGVVVGVDGRRHRDDDEAALAEHGGIGGVAEFRGRELFARELLGAVDAGLQFVDSARADVEPDDLETGREKIRQRQPDVAETDDGDLFLTILEGVEVWTGHGRKAARTGGGDGRWKIGDGDELTEPRGGDGRTEGAALEQSGRVARAGALLGSERNKC